MCYKRYWNIVYPYHTVEKIKTKIIALLLWSQKYTKADMLYIAKGSFWVGVNQAISGFLSLALIIAFANLLTKETYGLYSYILSIAGVLNIFTLTGINTAVSRSTAIGKTGILQRTVTYQLKWNLFMLVAFLGLAGYYLFKDETVLASSFFILGLFVPATLALNTYGAFLDGKKEFKLISILRTLSTFVYVGGMFVAILLHGDVVWLIATYTVTIFASTLFFYTYVLHKFKEPPTDDVEETLRYGRELTYIKFIDPVVSQIDKIILGHFWGPAQLATYSLALVIPNKAGVIMKSWVNIGFPKFATKDPGMINTVFYRRIFQGMFIGSLIAVTYILLAPYVFAYILPQYLEGIFYSQLLAINFVFALPNRYVNLLLASQKLSRLLFQRTILTSVIYILLYLMLGIKGGLLGLVIANMVGGVIGFLINTALWVTVSKHTS